MNRPESPSPVTLRDVAKALGVSHVTVSLALRNSPKITEARRKQIQELAQKMGYQPNAMATALAHFKRSSTVLPVRAALAWFNFWDPPEKLRSYAEFDRYWIGAANAAEKMGYHLEEFRINKRLPLARLEKILLTRGINGILLPPHQITPEWKDFAWDRFAVVRFGRSIQEPRVHLVTADQVANTMIAFKEALKRGYKRIGFVTGNASQRGALFEAGYMMAQRSVAPQVRLPICSLEENVLEENIPPLREWLSKEKPDAVLTDYMMAPDLIRKVGYRIPEDIGVAAMTVLDGKVDSGIYQNPEEVGRVASLVLVSLINDNSRGVPPIFRQVLVEGTWADGTSLPSRN